MRQDSFSDAGFEKYRNKESGMSQLRQTDYWIVHIGIQASAHAFSDSKSILFSVQPRIRHFNHIGIRHRCSASRSQLYISHIVRRIL